MSILCGRPRPRLVLVVPLVLSLLASSAAASIHASIPEDLYAFPKYRVSFLNGLPVSNDTAERWLRNGLQGGEPEFLDQWHPGSHKEIGSGDSVVPHAEPTRDYPPDEARPSPVLEHMRLGPSKSYMCLIPPAPTLPPPPPDDTATPVTPSHSWSLLQPLSGTCIYHRQGWFTYSYCHNLHVRQFRELPAQHPHPPGGRVVEEDPEWESYTLGRSPSSRSVGGELTVNDELALANNLELARQGAGQRYLVQRWSDGTSCDKTGRPREIEVQFHCSMTMTDTIMFVKETRTCEYVLVIHTPRLCGEPGFKSRLEQMPEAALRCREVVADVARVDPTLPEARHPFKRTPRQPIPAPPPPSEEEPGKARGTVDRAQDTAKLLRRALEALLGRGDDGADDVKMFQLQPGEEDGEFFIDLGLDDVLYDGDGDDEGGEPGVPVATGKGKSLEEALRAAGYDIKGQKGGDAGQKGGDAGQRGGDAAPKKGKAKKKPPPTEPRDEL